MRSFAWLLFVLAACSDATSVPTQSGRFQVETHVLNGWKNHHLFVIKDTKTGKEYMASNMGALVEVK